MFNEYYPYRLQNIIKDVDDPNVISVRYYTFRSGLHYYVVEAEEYLFEVFALKYYLTEHRDNPRRYRILSNEHKMSRIVRTCIDIMLSIYKERPAASFGFIGSNRLSADCERQENMESTQRFRIYRYAVEQLIGPGRFIHAEDVGKSRYVMLNRETADNHLLDYILNALQVINPSGD